MNYEENELEDYARYMQYIKRAIIEELADFNIALEGIQIDFGHIDRIGACELNDMSNCTWGFQYTIKKSGKNPMYFTKEMRYSQQMSYHEWKRIQTTEAREKKIDSILQWLLPEHKDILEEGLKMMARKNEQ